MASESGGHSNRLLASLPAPEYAHLEPHLEPFRLPMKEVLHEPRDVAKYVYFPISGVISTLIVLEDGDSIEVATIGNQGMADVEVVFGLEQPRYRLVVQVPGAALRMRTKTLRGLLQDNPTLQATMARYLSAMFTLVAQSSACNRLHPIQERCARWLLMTHDRVGADNFPVTQEFLAEMLGVRRPSVTLAAGMLKEAGLIRYNRGKVTVLDRRPWKKRPANATT